MELCDKIKEIRSKFGLTQEGLAEKLEKLNVSMQAVAKWEIGNGVPDTENLKTISRLSRISIDTLLDNESDVPLMGNYTKKLILKIMCLQKLMSIILKTDKLSYHLREICLLVTVVSGNLRFLLSSKNFIRSGKMQR